jgi:(4S)-4-hydroxy-5-phosphonooxypentane-2,3-dione isomerase
MYVVVVNVHVKPEDVTAFVAATRENYVGTRGEPGNARFDILRRNDDPNRFVFYEAYHDESAFSAHQRTAHYSKWKETVAPMMAEPRSSQKCTSVFPEPWQ